MGMWRPDIERIWGIWLTSLGQRNRRVTQVEYFSKKTLWKCLDFVATWQELEFWRLSYGRKLDHDKAAFMEDVFLITGSGSFQFLPNILPVGYN